MAKASKKISPKILIIGIIAVVVVGVIGYMMMGKNPASQNIVNNGDNAFASIRDALSKSVSLECEMTDEEGGMTKAYIKNGAVRADMTSSDPSESGSMIMKDQTLYTWSGAEGVTMRLEDGDYGAEGTTDEASQGDEFIEELEQYKESCKPAIVDDSLFTPPSDVTFVDMSTVMQGEMSEDELKKIMEMYSEE